MALWKIRWDIIGLSKVRKKGENLLKQKKGDYFYYYGETKGNRVVGFYMKNRIWQYVQEIKCVNERICYVKLKPRRKEKLVIIQVYAPILDAEEDDKIHTMSNIIRREQEYYTIIMGDFNGKIGKVKTNKIEGRQRSIIPHTMSNSSTNNNGRRILQLASAYNLKVAGTFFKKQQL